MCMCDGISKLYLSMDISVHSEIVDLALRISGRDLCWTKVHMFDKKIGIMFVHCKDECEMGLTNRRELYKRKRHVRKLPQIRI